MLRAVERDLEPADGARFEFFAWADRLLGIDLARTVGQQAQQEPVPEGIADLIEQRATARSEKDFATSDRIRDELAERGFTVTDTPDGQVVERS